MCVSSREDSTSRDIYKSELDMVLSLSLSDVGDRGEDMLFRDGGAGGGGGGGGGDGDLAEFDNVGEKSRLTCLPSTPFFM